MGPPACAPGRHRQQGGPARSRRRTAHPARPGGRPRAGTVERSADRPSTVLLTSAAPTPDLADRSGPGSRTGSRPRPSCGHRWRRPPSRWSTGLAREAGVDPRGPSTPFLDARARDGRDRRGDRRGPASGRPARTRAPGRGGDPCPCPGARHRADGSHHLPALPGVRARDERRRSRRLPRSLAGSRPADPRGRGDPGRPVRATARGQPGGPPAPCRGRRTDRAAPRPRAGRRQGDRRSRSARATDEPLVAVHRLPPDARHGRHRARPWRGS